MARPQGEGGSPFDLMQSSMMDVVNAQFGYKATWSPLAGGPTQNAVILFKDATKNETVLLNLNYELLFPEMEYKFEYFIGLEASVRDTTHVESVTISFAADGSNDVVYDVRKIKAKYDGKTFVATLEQQS
jgi:hypothetical protein